MTPPDWRDAGAVEDLSRSPLTEIKIERTRIAISFVNGTFGAISSLCNHVGGPLGQGRLDGEYIVCPWHNWKFHCCQGQGEPGYEQDQVPGYTLKVEAGRVWIDMNSATPRRKTPHDPHALARSIDRQPGPVRVAGISTTVMDVANPRYSTSDALLEEAINHASGELGRETRLIKLRDLQFRACEGYYSKSARACTWPCSITQMDLGDQLTPVYEAFVHWADVILVSTSIRWGAASSL